LYAGRKRENMIYKLTDGDGQTRGGTQWGPGVSHSGTGEGELCGPGWIHAYEHPLVAVLLNPIHADFKHPRLWEAEGEIAIRDGQLKCGCKTLTTIREIPLPEITTEMRVRFAILCAKDVCADLSWNAWANGWLSGEDRSAEAAYRSAEAAYAAQAAAAAAEAAWAAYAAYAAARAAAAAEAAWAAWAAHAAARAAAAAAREVGHGIDIFEIAEQSLLGLTLRPVFQRQLVR
jgi:hypothetical protein